MKTFTAKTLNEALALATLDFGLQTADDLNYEITEDKKGLFGLGGKVTIKVYETSDIVDYACEYLKTVIEAFEINPEFMVDLSDEVVRITIDSDHNSILIGKNGRTLQALNELVKIATSSRFKKRVRVLLDINEYKDNKYRKVISIAKRTAKEVQRSKMSATLDAMPADERRMIHNALSKFSNIKTESIGTGYRRQVVIKYVD